MVVFQNNFTKLIMTILVSIVPSQYLLTNLSKLCHRKKLDSHNLASEVGEGMKGNYRVNQEKEKRYNKLIYGSIIFNKMF